MTDREELALSVIAPCFNEEGNVAALVERVLPVLAPLPEGSELVLVDDGSRDRTWERIEAERARHDNVVGVRHEVNRGIEGGWLTGLQASSAPLVCLIDSDLQNRPEDVARLFRLYCDTPDIDLVQAVRRPARGVRRLHLFSRALNHLLNLGFGMRMRDNKSGFILCHRDVLSALLRHRYDYRYFQALIGASAGARGFSIAEVETIFDDRHAGESFLSRVPIGPSLTIVWEMAKFRIETWRDDRTG
jgi:phenylacetate-CoA ligase